MTTSTDIAPTTKVTLLKHLASGKGLDVVATIVGLKREEVLDVASHHGYPDREKLAWAADILVKKIEEEGSNLPDRTSETRREERRVTLTEAPSPSPAPLTKPDEIRILLNTAKGHESKRIQNAANKVLDDIDRLRTLIREDHEKHAARRRAEQEKREARRKAEEEKAAARAEVEKLEQQLAEARAKLRGGTTSARSSAAAADGPSAAQVRAWAAENDVECPAVGRVPNVVRQAYDEAHLQAAS